MVRNLPANAGDVRDLDLIPESERAPGGGDGNPLQYSCLENPMGRGAWRATIHRVAKSRTQLKQISTHILNENLVSYSHRDFSGSLPIMTFALQKQILILSIFYFCEAYIASASSNFFLHMSLGITHPQIEAKGVFSLF